MNGELTAEAALRQIWTEVLELDEVDAADNFFDLGADSMQAVEVVLRARENGLRIEVPDLFTTDTLAELATLAGGR
ncbi:phosphopantetheine-binding protein [Nucisporomicrobium flavum]|jgi:acyl carrier protein|uniref:phosphopantetheine-binding protein n=1 Tax=Nucisporomicrobium flavum TaxID=2785915 RepID=UPI0018F72D37|nr:phosphopantetheine-binding protein [Nucisporomicrobium flavum]